MSLRRLAAALTLLLAAAVATASGAIAQLGLDGGEIDTAEYPTLELQISLPSGATDGAANPASYTIIEGDEIIRPEVEALAATDLDVVLAVDTSGSMSGQPIEAARAAAAAFVALLPDSARVALVGFGPEPDVLTPLTADRDVFNAALRSLAARGETALYDAVVEATALLETTSSARTALVVLSDGGDTVSVASLDAASRRASEGFDVVHAISLISTEQDAAALDAVVSGGGSVAQAEDSVSLAGLYRDVADRIINQYRLRWDTTLVETGSVEIRFDAADGQRSAQRDVIVDATLTVIDTEPTPTAAPNSIPEATPTDAVESSVIAPRLVETAAAVGRWILAVGVVLLGVALFLIGLIVFAPREKTRSLASEMRDRVPRGRELSSAGRRLVETVEGILRRNPDRQRGLALRLDRAGLDWTPGEFGALLVGGGAVLALLGFALVGFLGLVALPALGIVGAIMWIDQKGQSRSNQFVEQLDGTLQLMAGTLRSGFGIMQALSTVAEETEWPTNEEFTRVLGEVRLGRDLTDAFQSSAVRIDSEDFHWVVEAVGISREVGGNLSEVLDNISQTIRQRNTLRRQVRSLSAEGRASAAILFALPIVMFVWIRFSNPDYVQLLFDRTGGKIAVGTGLGLLVVGFFWLRKIVQVRF